MKNLFEKQINEVAEIEAMFFHLKDSARVHEKSLAPFKFFGFPETTIHYHIFRSRRLEEEEMQNKWRYRDQDENGLERCLAMLQVYNVMTDEPTRNSSELLSIETLEILSSISNSYLQRVA